MPDIKPSIDENPTIIEQVDSSLGVIIPEKAVDEDIPDLSLKTMENIPGKNILYSRSVLATFSSGMVDPFLTTIAIDMGSTGIQMGWLRAITNLLGNFVQPFFGFLSDKVRRRSLFIALSNILYSGTWIILLFINNVTFLIAMAGFLSLVVSLGAPAWTALLGDVIPHKIRGKIIANINWYSQLSAIISTIVGGVFFNFISGQFSIGGWNINLNMFLPILLGLTAGIGSAVLMFTFNEAKATKRMQKIAEMLVLKDKSKKAKKIELEEEYPIIQRETTVSMEAKPNITLQSQTVFISESEPIIKEKTTSRLRRRASRKDSTTTKQRILSLLKNPDYMKFTIIFGIQSFFMSLCWPLYPIRQYEDIPNVGYFEIAIFSVVMNIATVLTIRYSGIVSDRIGRKTQIFVNRFVLAILPLCYVFATKIWHVIVINEILSIFLGLTSAILMAYLIDVTPEKDRSMYVGVFNMFSGILLFFGSLFGGYLLDFLMGELTLFGLTLNYSQFTAVNIALLVGFSGRLLTAMPFLALKEAKKFPNKLRDLPKLVFYNRRFPMFIFSQITLIGLTVGFMFLMGYLP